MRLTIQPVPEPLWGHNLRAVLSPTAWRRLRMRLLAERGLTCEICGVVVTEGKRLHAHEDWHYDTGASPAIARVTGITLSCRMCHAVEHIGRTHQVAASGVAPSALEDAIAHFCRVNGVDRAAFQAHKDEAFAEWRRRNTLRWRVDLGGFAPDGAQSKTSKNA